MSTAAVRDPGRAPVAAYFTLSGLYTLSAALIWGVNTLFLLAAGLSFFEVFVANAAFSLGTVLFEIPTGVVADTLGRRFSVLVSVAVLSVSTLAYVGLAEIGGGVVAFAAASVLMALGFTFYSGAMEAWVVDALAAVGYRSGLDRVFARGQQVTGAAMLVGTVGGGLLGQIDLALPYALRSALLVAVFVVALVVMGDVGFSPRPVTARELPGEIATSARAGIAFGWARRPIRLLMLTSLVQFGFLSWAFYAAQPYMLELLDRDAVWVSGLVTACIAGSTIVGNQVVTVASRPCERRTTLLLVGAGIQAGAAVVLGLTASFWVALAALLLVTGSMGLSSPVRQAFLNQLIPAERRATVLSFDSMVSGVGGVGGQVTLGALGEARSVGAAFAFGGLATTLALPLLGALRRIGSPADRIEGPRPVGSCVQGLPGVAAVESHSVEELKPAVAGVALGSSGR